ncbi:MAG: autotransporter domain-containing protein [Bacteroidetes bacterium]|nr:autotransporter domain-containing protein [Bacteroidota bacterium]
MKRLLFINLILLNAAFLQAQDTGSSLPEKQRRFHAGISYSFFSTSLDITSFSAHSVWYGKDLGTFTADDEEIDRINNVRSDINQQNMLTIQVGAILLDKPEGHWFIDASLLLGVSANNTQTDLNQPELNEMTTKSGLENPAGGVSINIRYDLNPHWGITVVPEFYYSWGETDNISDKINPMTHFFNNNLTEDFSNSYGRIGLLASYSVKRFTVSAGPGFYYAQMKKSYKIQRSDPETGNEFYDEIKSTLISRSFIDGCLKADWTFINPLTLSVQVAAGKDLIINTGIRYNF